MPHWNTDRIEAAILEARHDALIERCPQGGDVDTACLNVALDQATCYERRVLVRGFTTSGFITSPDDCDIELVELQDGVDSSGGIVSDDPDVIQLYADVKKVLARLGLPTVATLDGYF